VKLGEKWNQRLYANVCKSAGVLNKDLNVTTCDVMLTLLIWPPNLIPQVVGDSAYSIDECVDILAVCHELSEEEEFLVAACSYKTDQIDDDEEDCMTGEVENGSVPKIDSFKNVLKSLQLFLQNKWFTEEALKVDSLITAVAHLYFSCLVFSKQTTLDSYFSKQSEELLSDWLYTFCINCCYSVIDL